MLCTKTECCTDRRNCTCARGFICVNREFFGFEAGDHENLGCSVFGSAPPVCNGDGKARFCLTWYIAVFQSFASTFGDPACLYVAVAVFLLLLLFLTLALGKMVGIEVQKAMDPTLDIVEYRPSIIMAQCPAIEMMRYANRCIPEVPLDAI